MSAFRISADTIDPDTFRASMGDRACGAYAQFEGWVRDHNEGQQVLRLEYEVYEPLAVREGERILAEAAEKFAVSRVAAVHRTGLLELSDVAVVVGASAAHRAAAFDACRYVIDHVKHRLPIWKKEYYASGDAEWVNCRHCADSPGAERPRAPASETGPVQD